MSVRLAGTSSAIALMAVLSVAKPSPAQDQSQPSASAPKGLEEIVVTARRREEKVQTVPISINAFSGAEIERHEIQSVTDLQKIVPALTTYQTQRDEETFIIRGEDGSGASAQGQEPTVTLYFAQVPLPTGDGAGPGRYYDLENLQVLKGPQGTLFGRNSTGGAVLFEPKRPTNQFEGYAQVQFGNYSDREFEAAINLPIVEDKLLVRVAGSRAQRDGFTHNVTTNIDEDSRDYWAGRIGVTLRPMDDIENYLVYDSYYSHSTGTSQIIEGADANFVLAEIPLPDGTLFPFTLGDFFPNVTDVVAQQRALGIRTSTSDVNALEKTYSWGITDVARWSILDNLTIKNIASYREFKQLSRADLDGSSLPLIDITTPGGWAYNTAQYTEELQLQGKAFEERLNWVAGGFLLFSHPAGQQGSETVQFASPIDQIYHQGERSQALYAQGTYDLSAILDGLTFTAGYRYSWDWRALDTKSFVLGACNYVGADANCDISVSAPFHAGTWTLGLDYQITPRTLLYVTSRRGYRTGGLNTQVFTRDQVPFGPQYVTDVEIGIKSDWDLFGMQGRTNFDVYHSDIKGVQISQPFSLNSQTINLIVNSTDATVQGVEFDGTLIPVKGLELSASWAYTQAKYDNYVVLQTHAVIQGQQFPYNPMNKLALGVRYYLPVNPELGDISLAASWNYASHEYVAVLPDPFGIQGDYDILDLRADWKSILGTSFDAAFFMKNVTDAAFNIGGVPIFAVAGYSSAVYSEPRMYGFQLRYHW